MCWKLRASPALIVAGALLAGCAANGSDSIFTTGALGSGSGTAANEQKVDPACVTLASRIETLRREGIAEKLDKAAAKKYKMTHADLVKADQLAKSDAEFQLRCSTIQPTAAQLSPAPAPAPTAKSAGAKAPQN